MKPHCDTSRPTLSGLLGVALAFALAGPAHAAAATEALSGSLPAFAALIGDAACDDDSQCRTLPVGSKPCGGPEYYLAWSTKRTDVAALRQAAAGDVSPPGSRRPGEVSTCVVVTDPGAYCARATGPDAGAAQTPGGVCRLRGTGRGGSGRVD